MKIIQTFWSGTLQPESALEIKTGWLSPEYHWMSWALSCLLLRRHYEKVELFTDALGKKILIDTLKLPYTDCHIIFDNTFQIDPHLFSLAKIKTYQSQKTPFIHIDGDIFLWKKLPQSIIEAPLVASNLEIDLFFNKEILDETATHFTTIPHYLKGVNAHEHIFASNAGIIGGNNLDFIQKYCDAAFNFIESNKTNIEKVTTRNLNFLVEQISLYYLAESENIPVSYYMPEPVDHPLYADYLRFVDVPDVAMVHPVGGCKRFPFILNHLANRLKLEFPEYFYHILHTLKQEQVHLDLGLYNFIDLHPDTVQNTTPGHPEKAAPALRKLNDFNFKKVYKRTLETCFYHTETVFESIEALIGFVENENTPPQIKEVYTLENEVWSLYSSLIEEVGAKDYHITEFNQYKKTAQFSFDKNWRQKKIKINSGVQFLNPGWYWEDTKEKPLLKRLEKTFEEEKNDFLVTLNYNALHLKIEETYHQGLDELVLKCLQKNTDINELLLEVINHFEDDITVENMGYQQLIFDTLKRFAFGKLISIT